MPDRAAGLTGLVLGAAAGGGFPQWNCGCRQCCARACGRPTGSPGNPGECGRQRQRIRLGRRRCVARPAPADLADTAPVADGRRAAIHRSAGVVLIGGDVDAIAGLLVLRERQAFTVYAPRPLLDLLDANRIFDVLDPVVGASSGAHAAGAGAMRRRAHADAAADAGKGSAVSGGAAAPTQPEPGPNYAALLQANGRSVIVAPACADITDAGAPAASPGRPAVLRRHAVHRRRDDRGRARGRRPGGGWDMCR